MAEETNKTPNYLPQNQQERWLKYGLNVGVAIIVVIALAICITWLAEKKHRRIDTTATRVYSLKPQTLNIIDNLKSPVRIVSLYTTPQKTGATDEDRINENAADQTTDYKQIVADLLDEYHSKGKNIEVENIDPVETPSKVDDLINYVTNKYGGEVQKYKDFLAKYPSQFDKLNKIATDEAAQVTKLPLDQADTPELQQTVGLAIFSVQNLPKQLQKGNESIDRLLKNTKPPDYKRATEAVQSNMETLSTLVGQVIDDFSHYKDDAKVPEAIRKYITESIPRYEQIKKMSDDIATEVKNLGELKLDELRQNLRQQNSILVMGDNEMRSLSFEQVWPQDTDVKNYVQDAPVKRRFAGEQQISTAIFSLQQKGKRKVVFVRPGGSPLTEAPVPLFRRGGPLSMVADRLRDYNFDVMEKDLSGMWAMQQQMQQQQMPSAPEPTDEQIKDAIWVVVNIPNDQQQPGMPPPAPIGPKIAQHLKDGYPVLVLMSPQAENLAESLKDYGIETRPDAVAVHEIMPSTGARSNDMADEAQRLPFVFVTNKFGDHALTKPLASLDFLALAMVPVQKAAPSTQPTTQPVTATALLTLPDQPKSWGETNLDSVQSDSLKFDDKTDLPGPVTVAMAGEKGGNRVVVLGGVQPFTDQILRIPDIEMAKRGQAVARFPANSELFVNSIFWLAKMEPMIAISPNAMEVSRIADIKPAALNAWRVGLLLVGLPGLVVLSGLFVYFSRRD